MVYLIQSRNAEDTDWIRIGTEKVALIKNYKLYTKMKDNAIPKLIKAGFRYPLRVEVYSEAEWQHYAPPHDVIIVQGVNIMK